MKSDRTRPCEIRSQNRWHSVDSANRFQNATRDAIMQVVDYNIVNVYA